MPLTGTAAPGTGPGAGPGAWSRGRAAAVGPEHGAGHSFLMAAARRCPRTSVGQSPPHRPSCDSPPPSPRRHRHRCLASRRGPLPLGPRPDAGAPGTRPPLPAPGGKPGDGTPTPPVLYAWSGPNFFDIYVLHSGEIPAEDTPRVMGPRPKNFKPIFGRGISRRGQAHRYPLKKRVHASVACSRFDQGVSPRLGGVIAGGAPGGRGRPGEGRRHPVPIS